jgi:phosphodiesterase/alkaline phosphatase D-like protein
MDYGITTDGGAKTDQAGRKTWRFRVPAADAEPTMVYASCNGFSSADLVRKTDDPYALWDLMKARHEEKPFSLLMMGGDQLYADEMWGRVPELVKWSEQPRNKRVKQKPSKTMLRHIESFYENLYQARWKDPVMSELLASIPSVMMWDDHDIFDGWGSYPEDLQTCPVYEAIFGIAKRYFELFQIRSKANKSLLEPDQDHYAFSVEFRGQHILGLDNRTERTLGQVMSNKQWDAVATQLENKITSGNLFVLSALPVVYRDFSVLEAIFDATPWDEELTDDIKDHWRSKQHEGERARLIMRLLENSRKRTSDRRTVILSGDVHVGCLGVIIDRRDTETHMVHQIVSSGIVHPAPSRTQWLGITAATNDDPEYLNEEKTIEISMLNPFGSDKYIRSRNFVSLEEGTDQKLWVNWFCENGRRPSFPLV